MQWYYNSNTGAVSQMLFNPTLHLGTGWHGPFPTKEAAIAFYEAGKAANPGWRDPKNPTFLGSESTTSAILGSSFAKNANVLLIRIGEILLGLILIGVGLAKLTGTSNAIASLVKAGVTKGVAK